MYARDIIVINLIYEQNGTNSSRDYTQWLVGEHRTHSLFKHKKLISFDFIEAAPISILCGDKHFGRSGNSQSLRRILGIFQELHFDRLLDLCFQIGAILGKFRD